MDMNTTKDERYLRAKRRLDKEKEFYRHLFCYVVINLILILINYWTFWEVKWFFFPAVGWGVGLAFHAASVFLVNGFFGAQWEERKIRQYMREEEENTRWE